jgi:hypothetical protein
MSANLPTVQVDDYDATLEAFGGADGYREWLRALVADRVEKYHRVVVEREVDAFREERLKKVRPNHGPPAPPLPEAPGSEQPVAGGGGPR